MEFALLQSYTNYIDAYIAMGRLEEEDIRCWLKDEHTVTIDPILTNAIGGIKLMVAAPQLGRALHLVQQLEEEKRRRHSCPQCNSHDIALIHSPRKAANWISAITTFLMGSYALGVEQTYRCFACDHEFEEPVEEGESGVSSR